VTCEAIVETIACYGKPRFEPGLSIRQQYQMKEQTQCFYESATAYAKARLSL
jgi:hypothetical protein